MVSDYFEIPLSEYQQIYIKFTQRGGQVREFATDVILGDGLYHLLVLYGTPDGASSHRLVLEDGLMLPDPDMAGLIVFHAAAVMGREATFTFTDADEVVRYRSHLLAVVSNPFASPISRPQFDGLYVAPGSYTVSTNYNIGTAEATFEAGKTYLVFIGMDSTGTSIRVMEDVR